MPKVDELGLDDPARLAAVYAARRVLPVTSLSLDSIAELAAGLAAAPMAVLALVGATAEEFVGAFGLPDPLATSRRTDRGLGLCPYVVSVNRPIAVPDLTQHRELESHPLVRAWSVRAFAGAPLRDADGVPIGAVTVIDTVPRDWTSDQLSALARIARMLTPAPTPEAGALAALAAAQQNPSAPAGGTSVNPAVGMQVQQRFIDALLDSLQVGVIAFDSDHRPVLFNRALRNLYGIDEDTSPEEAATVAYGQIHHLDGTPMSPDELAAARALTGQTVRELPILLIAPGMPDRYLVANGQPIRSTDGELIGGVATILDITERRRHERFGDCQLQVATRLNQANGAERVGPQVVEAVGRSLDWAHVSLWLADAHSDTLRRSAEWTAPGYDLDDVIPAELHRDGGATRAAWKTGASVWVPDYPHSAYATHPEERDFAAACAERGLHTVLAAPIRLGDTVAGVLTGLCATAEHDEFLLTGLFENIAAQLGSFLTRQRSAELARQLVLAKDDFIALVGHEMRTPLTSIVTYSDLLLEDPRNDDPTQNMLEALCRNASRLREIIEDLLDLAALDAGRFQLQEQPVDLARLVTAAVDEVPALPPELKIHLDVAPDLIVTGDEHRLRQVVDGLLSNAIKYSPDGGDIRVELTARDRVAELAVTDSGIGIPVAERDQLFHRFYRASNVRHTTLRGTGLGLVRARTIIEAHRGTITVDPAPATGTRIIVRLPRPQ